MTEFVIYRRIEDRRGCAIRYEEQRRIEARRRLEAGQRRKLMDIEMLKTMLRRRPEVTP